MEAEPPRGQRLSLFGIFGFGFLTCCFSLVRIGWLNIGRDGDDDSYYNVEAAGWSIGELACAMTVTCLPSLRPLIFKMRRPDKKRPHKPAGQKGLWMSISPPTVRSVGAWPEHSAVPVPAHLAVRRGGGLQHDLVNHEAWVGDVETGYYPIVLLERKATSSDAESVRSLQSPGPFLIQYPEGQAVTTSPGSRDVARVYYVQAGA